MMSEKRGAVVAAAAAAVVAIMLLFLHSDVAEADNYVVGTAEHNYWAVVLNPDTYYSENITGQATSDDTLEFKYNGLIHNVVKVDMIGYNNCNGTGFKNYTSGDDQIKLDSGMNYFICTTNDNYHCKTESMKMSVNATN